jgi:hypothetical protein
MTSLKQYGRAEINKEKTNTKTQEYKICPKFRAETSGRKTYDIPFNDTKHAYFRIF